MTRQFEVTDYLQSPEDVAAYLNEAFATGDPEFVMIAIEDILKTRVISEVAKKAKINRVSLHKALSERRDVKISTMSGIADALGCQLAFVPKAAANASSPS